MAFKSTAENGGVVDASINTSGRPKVDKEKKLTRREIKEKEFLALARKIKPHIADAIRESAKIMTSTNASDQNKLKASAFLFSVYKDLIGEVYEDVQDVEGEELPAADEKPTGHERPKLSLTMTG